MYSVKDLQMEFDESRAAFKQASSSLHSFRSTTNFRLKLAQSKMETLLSEKFKDGSTSDEVKCLRKIIEEQNAEIV